MGARVDGADGGDEEDADARAAPGRRTPGAGVRCGRTSAGPRAPPPPEPARLPSHRETAAKVRSVVAAAAPASGASPATSVVVPSRRAATSGGTSCVREGQVAERGEPGPVRRREVGVVAPADETRAPRSRPRWATSVASMLLPMPASPLISRTPPRPVSARSARAAWIEASAAVRPTTPLTRARVASAGARRLGRDGGGREGGSGESRVLRQQLLLEDGVPRRTGRHRAPRPGPARRVRSVCEGVGLPVAAVEGEGEQRAQPLAEGVGRRLGGQAPVRLVRVAEVEQRPGPCSRSVSRASSSRAGLGARGWGWDRGRRTECRARAPAPGDLGQRPVAAAAGRHRVGLPRAAGAASTSTPSRV